MGTRLKKYEHFYMGLCGWHGYEELGIYYVITNKGHQMYARFKAGEKWLETTMFGEVIKNKGFIPEEVTECLEYLATMRVQMAKEAFEDA